MKILITGTAGFIGFKFSEFLLKKGHKILGYDSINDYYDVSLKYSRILQLKKYKKFSEHKIRFRRKKEYRKYF